MNFINKAFADLPPDVIISDIRKSNPCNINGIVKKVIIKKGNYECSDDVYIFIQSNNGLYKVFSSKSTILECTFDGSGIIYGKNSPEKGEKMNILVSDSYGIFGAEKKLDGNFYVYNESIGSDFPICPSNSNFIEFHKDYFIIGTGIISLVILGIIIYKKFKK